MIVGTAGHIDHGKTTLVRALTGVDTDRLKEEKARGISIELGYAYVPVEPAAIRNERLAGDDVLGFVDVPGHERLVHTMAAGASGIDFALLVIAADDGVMFQKHYVRHLQCRCFAKLGTPRSTAQQNLLIRPRRRAIIKLAGTETKRNFSSIVEIPRSETS